MRVQILQSIIAFAKGVDQKSEIKAFSERCKGLSKDIRMMGFLEFRGDFFYPAQV